MGAFRQSHTYVATSALQDGSPGNSFICYICFVHLKNCYEFKSLKSSKRRGKAWSVPDELERSMNSEIFHASSKLPV